MGKGSMFTASTLPSLSQSASIHVAGKGFVRRVILVAGRENIGPSQREYAAVFRQEVADQRNIHGPQKSIAAVDKPPDETGGGRILVEINVEVDVGHRIVPAIHRVDRRGPAPLSAETRHVGYDLEVPVTRRCAEAAERRGMFRA